MEGILYLIDVILHVDKHLSQVILDYGGWIYLLLFLIIFIETGLVAMPFLPGDSLLFAVGTFASVGALNIYWTVSLLIAAAILGDSVNYAIGKFLGPKVFCREEARFFKKEHLERTRRFYEKYGNKTIVLARFVPIIRTFAPFVAGIGRMKYGLFLFYNVLGGALWVVIFISAGYFFGNIPVIKHNFSIVILAIIVLSVLPVVLEFWKHHRQKTMAGAGVCVKGNG
jgi:membrane-associated protein